MTRKKKSFSERLEKIPHNNHKNNELLVTVHLKKYIQND